MRIFLLSWMHCLGVEFSGAVVAFFRWREALFSCSIFRCRRQRIFQHSSLCENFFILLNALFRCRVFRCSRDIFRCREALDQPNFIWHKESTTENDNKKTKYSTMRTAQRTTTRTTKEENWGQRKLQQRRTTTRKPSTARWEHHWERQQRTTTRKPSRGLIFICSAPLGRCKWRLKPRLCQKELCYFTRGRGGAARAPAGVGAYWGR